MNRAPFGPPAFSRPRPPSLVDLRIALVDEPSGLSAFRSLLAATGAIVTTASSYDEALASSLMRSCDVLIASLELPGATARGLERIVSSFQRGRACIALTRRSDGEGLDEAWRAGFRMCVRTPCEPELLASAAAVLGGLGRRSPS